MSCHVFSCLVMFLSCLVMSCLGALRDEAKSPTRGGFLKSNKFDYSLFILEF